MIRRYLEFCRLGLGWKHCLAEWLASRSPQTFFRVCNLLGTIEWLWRRRASATVAKRLRSLQALAGSNSSSAKPRDYFCKYWCLKLAHAYIALAPRERMEQILELEGTDLLREALELKRGVVLAGLHSLHGHLAAAYLVRLGTPTISFRKATRATLLGTAAERLIFYGAQPVFMDEAQPFGAVLKRAYDWLRQGNAVFVYVDGVYGSDEIPVPVLGRDFPFRPGLLRAASFLKTPVIGAVATCEGRKIRIRFLDPETIEHPDDTAKILQRLARAYEDVVRRCPSTLPLGKFEQWLIK